MQFDSEIDDCVAGSNHVGLHCVTNSRQMFTIKAMRATLKRPPLMERLSIPTSGRTLLANTRRWAEPLLEAFQKLVVALRNQVGAPACDSAYRENYSFLRFSKHQSHSTFGLYSAALILNWVVGRASGTLPKQALLYDAEKWFKGDSSSVCLSRELKEQTQKEILEPLRDLEYDFRFLDILPYATEVFETSDEILKAFGASRRSKRATGIYYTPSDVSDYIVSKVCSLNDDLQQVSQCSWLDPACGTGSFLISVLYKNLADFAFAQDEEALKYVTNCLYGIDVSPLALQSAAYTIALACGTEYLSKRITLQQALRSIGKNLAVYDATDVNSIDNLSHIFPALKTGADFVISNPPYAKRLVKSADSQRSLFTDSEKGCIKTENLYIAFIRMLSTLSNPHRGAGGMVVPLSIVYNTRKEFQAARRRLMAGDKWWLAHFDRTPDSLFGDDVKTRNTIIFFARQKNRDEAICTTNLIRWSSRSRVTLFDNISFSRMAPGLVSDLIPKVGDEFGQSLLVLIKDRCRSDLGQSIRRTDAYCSIAGRLLRNAGTAYNWLPFEIVSQGPDLIRDKTEEKYGYWLTQTTDDLAIVFALTQSRYAYWLWRVWGDGFHLTNQFIVSLPFSSSDFSENARSRLKFLGEALWNEMLDNKVISHNAGITSISYCPYISDALLNEIDSLITSQYGFPAEANLYLSDFIKQTVVAGREDEITSNPALRQWLKKEKENEHGLDRGKREEQVDERGVERIYQDSLAHSQRE